MRKISEIIVLEDFVLKCLFSDGTEVLCNLQEFMDSEVFQPLKDYSLFKNVKNHGYFISWQNETVDLSADTLWNIGKKIVSKSLS